MTPRRFRLEAALAAFVAAALLLLWLGPRVLNWERYRPELAAFASARLGRPVRLDGAISLTLLPQPRIEAGRVVIGPGADGVSLTARALRLRLGLAALARGRLQPRELALVGSEIRLPWPPAEPASLSPPPWLTDLDARLQDSRLVLGGLALEGLDGRIHTGPGMAALEVQGEAAWRGQAVRFGIQLGRPGSDGAAPLDLTIAAVSASFRARGILAPGGSFEGRFDAAGQDLALLLPTPPGPFRASGGLTAVADLVAATDIQLEHAGQPARALATLRLAPEPRLDLSLAAPQLELDPWVAALREPRGARLPIGLELAAEQARYAGLPLRRLRGALFAGAERLTLSDVSAQLPGEATLELTGASTAQRLELAATLRAPDPAGTLAALGLPPGLLAPLRAGPAELHARVALEHGEVAVTDLAGTLGGGPVSGAVVWRPAPEGGRANLGIGLTFQTLALGEAWPDLAGALAQVPGHDLTLRLAAETLRWRQATAQRFGLDAVLEAGRLSLPRLALRLGALDLTLAGAVQLGAQPRLGEAQLDLAGPNAQALARLLWPGAAALAAQPLKLRVSGTGPLDAVALRGELELGDARVEAQGTLDAPARRGRASFTLQHPSATRWLAELGVPMPWLGPGSLSLVTTLAAGPALLTAEQLELVAGGLRARAGLLLAPEARRLSGRVAAEVLPLPPLAAVLGGGPDALAPWRLDLALEAARVLLPEGPELTQARARLALAEGRLSLGGVQAGLAGGRLAGDLALEATALPPRLTAGLHLEGVSLAGLLGAGPVGLDAGELAARLQLTAQGSSGAAMLASLGGEVEASVRNGMLRGLDAAALAAAAERGDEAEMRRALAGGGTGFEELALALSLANGVGRLERFSLAGEGFAPLAASGELDLARGGLDLRLLAQPVAEAPALRLRLSGPWQVPRRGPELAEFLRWRAGR